MSHFDDDEDRKRDEWRRVCFLICPGCNYLEFPGCTAHHVLLSRASYNEDGEVMSVACETCDVSTTNSTPWSKHCRECKGPLAVPNAWITSKRAVAYLTMAIAGFDFKSSKVAKTGLEFCPDCKVVQFPGNEDILLGLKDGRLWDDKKKEHKSPASTQQPFVHLTSECRGSVKVVPVDISKEEATFVRDCLAATAPLPAPKKGKSLFKVDADEGISTHLAKIWFDEKFCDVNLLVGEEKTSFNCHKLILAARSPYFQAMFYSKWLEAGLTEVELPDVETNIFNLILKTIYQDEIELDSDTVLPALFAAKRFGVEALKKACVNFMSEGVDRENVLSLYENTPDLLDEERFALKFIEDNAQEILLQEQFLELSPSSVEKIVASPALSIREVDLWSQVVTWAQREVRRRELKAKEVKEGKGEEKGAMMEEKKVAVFSSKSSIPTAPPMSGGGSRGGGATKKTVTFPRLDVDMSALRDVLRPLIPHFRFPLFKIGELGSMVARLELLEKRHMVQLYTYSALPTKPPTFFPADFPYSHKPREPRRPMGIPLLKTDRFEDNSGILWWIGTQEGKVPTYTNPINGEVGVRMSTTAGTGVHALGDRNYVSTPVENSYGSDPTPWIEFDFKKYKVRPTHYFVAQEQDHYIRNWRIEGSDDGTTWTLIRDHNNDSTITTSNRHAFFDLPTPADRTSGFWRRLRLYLYGPSHNGSVNMDVTQMEWFGYVITE